MNVELMGSQKIFGRYADGIISHPHSTVADAVIESVTPGIPEPNKFVSDSDEGHRYRGQNRVSSSQEQRAREDSDLMRRPHMWPTR
jgi:hypothetical protein